MTNRKTATVTWIKYHNFGTCLQAYALQQVILGLGFQNEILDDSLIGNEKKKCTLRVVINKLYCLVKKCVLFKFYCRTNASFELYQQFKNKYLLINEDILPLHSVADKYDIFICGSDQIWFPSEHIFFPYYYLDFTQKKKIAYAPSIGVPVYPECFKLKVKPLLEQFSSLSVREKEGADLLAEFVNKPISTVLDPTLLLTKSHWERFIQDTGKQEKDYILCYFLTPNQWYLDYVKRFAAQKNLPVKIFATHVRYVNWKNLLFAGPEEFLNAIYKSTYFFTDSFHGSVFSILFEKRFYTFQRFEEDSQLSQNSRIRNLFRLLELEDYFFNINDLEKIDSLPFPDYQSVNILLEQCRQESVTYLKHALEN